MNRFDEKASRWDTDEKTRQARMVAKAIDRRIPSSPGHELRAMEYGCGTALVGLALRSRFSELDLVDSSEGMIGRVREKLDELQDSSITADVCDLSKAPTGEQGPLFDVIFSVLAFHHIPNTEQTLANIRALLETGGKFFLVDMDEDDGHFHRHFDGFEGHHGFDRSELEKVVTRAGFHVDEVTTVGYMGAEEQTSLFLLEATAA